MPVKYQCPKCNRRFADWGAEKLSYQCPHDDHCPPDVADETIELVRVGGPIEDPAPSGPTLKRRSRKAAAKPPAEEEVIEEETKGGRKKTKASKEKPVEAKADEADQAHSGLDEDDDNGDSEEVPEDLDFEDDTNSKDNFDGQDDDTG